MHTLPEFTTIEDCPTNRDRINAWYRKAMPDLLKGGNTWPRLIAKGNAVKRHWRKYWQQRQTLKFSNTTHFQSRKTP